MDISIKPPRLDPRLQKRIDEKKMRLDSFRPLASIVTEQLNANLRLLLTYNSNAIEGNTLSLRETQVVIENGLTVGGHTLREHLEATNHAQAFDYLLKLAEQSSPITVQTVAELHRLVMGQLDQQAGNFRNGPVFIRGASMTPPPSRDVPNLMTEWANWLTGEGRQYSLVLRAAIAHHGFEAVHPFFDGNGRTGRLLMNLLLMRDGFVPALLLAKWRLAYYTALDAANFGDYNALANLIGRAVEGGLDLYLEACDESPDEQYLPLSQLAEGSGYSVDYLGWLIRKGKLPAKKRGRFWYTTAAAMERYKSDK